MAYWLLLKKKDKINIIFVISVKESLMDLDNLIRILISSQFSETVIVSQAHMHMDDRWSRIGV